MSCVQVDVTLSDLRMRKEGFRMALMFCVRCRRFYGESMFTVSEARCDECVKRRARPPKRTQKLSARPRDMFRATGEGRVAEGNFEQGKRR
jgi:hypothetical protein